MNEVRAHQPINESQSLIQGTWSFIERIHSSQLTILSAENVTLWWANIKIFCGFGCFLGSFSRFSCRILILERILSYIHQVLSLSNFSRIKPKIQEKMGRKIAYFEDNSKAQFFTFETFELISNIIQARKLNSIAYWIESLVNKSIHQATLLWYLSVWNTESEWPLSEVDGVSGSLKELKFRGKYNIKTLYW